MVEMGAVFLISCFFFSFCGYLGYLTWFDYPQFESKLVRWYRFWNGSVAKGGGYLGGLARKYIFHWSYKWLARLNFTLGFLVALFFIAITFGGLTGLIK
jgi:prolipoprotein diacylglyceryltransferase